MSYYDLDAILTDAQKVPCTFNLTVPQLGYLDGTPALPLKQDTSLPLPLWLAVMLAVSSPGTTATGTSSSSLVTLDLPACLSTRVLNALKADPKSVDLRAQAPNFYAVGARMLELFEEEEVADVLLDAWMVRASEVGDYAENMGGGQAGHVGAATEGVEFLRGLEEDERRLFRVKHESGKALRKWMGETKSG